MRTDHVRGHRLGTAFVLVGGLTTLAVGVVLVLNPAEGEVRFDDLRVGDCLQTLEDGEQARTVQVAECDEPHAGEVFATFEIEGDDLDADFPGDQRVGRLAEQGCSERLGERDVVGADRYAVTTVAPTAESWQEGDRVVHCVLGTQDGAPLTGPLLQDDDG